MEYCENCKLILDSIDYIEKKYNFPKEKLHEIIIESFSGESINDKYRYLVEEVYDKYISPEYRARLDLYYEVEIGIWDRMFEYRVLEENLFRDWHYNINEVDDDYMLVDNTYGYSLPVNKGELYAYMCCLHSLNKMNNMVKNPNGCGNNKL